MLLYRQTHGSVNHIPAGAGLQNRENRPAALAKGWQILYDEEEQIRRRSGAIGGDFVVGFFDDDEFETLLAESNKFKPQELNEANVQAIFNRCLAAKDTPNADVQLSVLFKKVMGYDKDSDPMAFCRFKIEQNKKNILYLMGQLDSVHRGSRVITAKESIFRYDGKQWATTNAVIGELYHLAEAADAIDPFVKKYNRSATTPNVTPTLSPKDPAFPAWWKQHQSEWEA